MSKKNISQEKIIQAFLASAFEKSAGATSLADIAEILEIKKASLYNHFENRDAMYDATIYYCGKEIDKITFLPEKALDPAKTSKTTPYAFFKKMITRFFEMYENEPLFQMYAFIHTEQYFNVDALKIVEKEIEKIIPVKAAVPGEMIHIYETKSDGSIKLLEPYENLPSDDNELNKALGEQNDSFSDLLELEAKFCK